MVTRSRTTSGSSRPAGLPPALPTAASPPAPPPGPEAVAPGPVPPLPSPLGLGAAPTVRHAEKSRTATCAFADAVAAASIAEFGRRLRGDLLPEQLERREMAQQRMAPEQQIGHQEGQQVEQQIWQQDEQPEEQQEEQQERQQEQQRCLASIVCRVAAPLAARKSSELFVVALGSGTKFISPPDEVSPTNTEMKTMASAALRGEIVRDLHAEVLARRSFLRLLHAEAARCCQGRAGRLLELSPDAGAGCPPLRVRSGLSFHFYSSSVPCGNASIKRWAKGGQGPEAVAARTAPPDAAPPHNHPARSFFPARHQGQVAVLEKCASARAAAAAAVAATASPQEAVSEASPSGSWWPAGTRPFGGDFGAARSLMRPLLTCSDKMAGWNALGLQGKRLSAVVSPVFLESVTIGRKFSARPCARALCCRLQDFRHSLIPELPECYGIRHVAVLGCAVKLDQGVYRGPGAGAQFSDVRCHAWSLGDDLAEVLDGRTGRTLTGGTSVVAAASLRALSRGWQSSALASVLAAGGLGPSGAGFGFGSCGEQESELRGEAAYVRAKDLLRAFLCCHCTLGLPLPLPPRSGTGPVERSSDVGGGRASRGRNAQRSICPMNDLDQ